ncbi:YhcN/YlaJ family sporulation lipoprotein [Alkalihalobacterium elongatum]|uniref:YhcN/YlaJ family sporulation lipoprotein n=1 Tax=Alkalihalobacterium elongatum TaxID=2675466 RepID=UPI001C1F7EA0|nr:YhcN/YlaJ family sporulation lipoprotein [Alkalihalobacterium elongatum]
MKKKMITACVLSSMLLTAGCQTMMGNEAPNMQARHTQYNPSGGGAGILHSERNAVQNPEHAEFGFVRHQKAQEQRQHRQPDAAYIDRDLLADAISKMAVYLPQVEECGTLVTDKYILVAYKADAEENREDVALQVKVTAQSMAPRYLDVYVTDNPEMMEDIERFGGLSSLTPRVDELLEQQIMDMNPIFPNLERLQEGGDRERQYEAPYPLERDKDMPEDEGTETS